MTESEQEYLDRIYRENDEAEARPEQEYFDRMQRLVDEEQDRTGGAGRRSPRRITAEISNVIAALGAVLFSVGTWSDLIIPARIISLLLALGLGSALALFGTIPQWQPPQVVRLLAALAWATLLVVGVFDMLHVATRP